VRFPGRGGFCFPSQGEPENGAGRQLEIRQAGQQAGVSGLQFAPDGRAVSILSGAYSGHAGFFFTSAGEARDVGDDAAGESGLLDAPGLTGRIAASRVGAPGDSPLAKHRS